MRIWLNLLRGPVFELKLVFFYNWITSTCNNVGNQFYSAREIGAYELDSRAVIGLIYLSLAGGARLTIADNTRRLSEAAGHNYAYRMRMHKCTSGLIRCFN